MPWIEKQRNILDFTLSSLFRRKGRNILLVIVYTLMVFMLASVLFFTHSIKREACLLLQNSPEIVVQKIVAGRHDLIPTGYIETIKDIRGVDSVKGRLWGYYYNPSVGANYTLSVPENFVHGAGNIVIGKGVARSFLANPGDIVPFKTYEGSYTSLEVKDTLSSESEIISSDLVLMSEDDFREISGVRKGYATDLTVSVRNPREISTVADKIRRILPDTRPIIKDEILRTYSAVFDWRSGLIMLILSGAVMAFIIFAWDKATGLSSEEKREIGILKGIGWETSDVLFMKFWEGTIVSHIYLIERYSRMYAFSRFCPFRAGTQRLVGTLSISACTYHDLYQLSTYFFLPSSLIPLPRSTVLEGCNS
jgi:hypothetical protein